MRKAHLAGLLVQFGSAFLKLPLNERGADAALCNGAVLQQRDAVFGTARRCAVMKGCFCHGRGLFMECWDERHPICLMVGCCLCSDTTALATEEIAEHRQGLRNPSCQVTLFFFSFFSLRHGERQPNLLFQLHFSHFVLLCKMFNKLPTSGVTAVLGPATLFPLQLRPPSLPFYLHNNTTPQFRIPLCNSFVLWNHNHSIFYPVLWFFIFPFA